MKCIVLGNITIDVVKTRNSTIKRMGGGSYYSALALSKFCNTVLVSSIGEDFPDEWRVRLKNLFEVIFLKAKHTTSFLLDYSGDTRRVFLLQRGGVVETFPIKRDLMVLNPVMGELNELKPPRGVPFTADLQGFLRRAKPRKEVELVARNLGFLNGALAIHGEREEVKKALGLDPRRIGVLVASEGRNGGMATINGKTYRYTHPKISTTDTTGSGDILLGALSYYSLRRSIPNALRLSIAFTLLFLERKNVSFSKGEVKKMARLVSILPVVSSKQDENGDYLQSP